MSTTIIDKMRYQIKWLTQQVECLKKEGCLCFSFETDLTYNSETGELSATFVDGTSDSVVIFSGGGAGFEGIFADTTGLNYNVDFNAAYPLAEPGFTVVDSELGLEYQMITQGKWIRRNVEVLEDEFSMPEILSINIKSYK